MSVTQPHRLPFVLPFVAHPKSVVRAVAIGGVYAVISSASGKTAASIAQHEADASSRGMMPC